MKRSVVIALISLLLLCGVGSQYLLFKVSAVKTPSIGSGIIASLGGLRSIASEVIWFRADKLERQGRFGELVQLASMLTFLEPHVTEVWTYSAWNLSYNISLRMPRTKS